MMKFYKCSHCGNIVAFVENKGVPVMCCGQKMDDLVRTQQMQQARNTFPYTKSKTEQLL